MTYDFDQIINRRGTNSMKWDEAEDPEVIPMWVADMDFAVAPCITEALHERINHPVFGYTFVPESYYEAVISWFARRHQWHIRREWIQYTSGVVSAVSCCIKAMTQPGDNVLVLTPVYNCFFSSIRNNKCNILESALLPVGDSFEIDYADVEKHCAKAETKILLLCNPHNPAGRVWTKQELSRINDICVKHGVIVVSDEIHCELTMPGFTFTPFANVSEECLNNSITLNSPSKSFNTAGLQIANIICSNADWQARIDRAINDNEVCDVNPFGVIALQAAYNNGEEWLDALRAYIFNNYKALKEFLERELPCIGIHKLEGTYLVWADISALGISADELSERLIREGKVWMTSGTVYHDPASQHHLRINIACPREQMMEGLQRFVKALSANKG